MRSFKYWLWCIALLCMISASANAIVIAWDNFDYVDGNLTGNDGGEGWSGAYTDGGNSLAVASSQIDETGGPGEVGTNYRGLSTILDLTNVPGGEVWMGFDGQLTLAGAWGYGGISPFQGAGEKGIIGAIIGRDMFGIGGEDTGVTGLNRIVVKFDLNTGDISLWAGAVGEPVDVLGGPLQTGSYSIVGTDNLRFALNSTDAGGNIQIDNLVLATTSGEVVAPMFAGVIATVLSPFAGETDVALDANLSWTNPDEYTATKFVLDFRADDPNWLDTANTTTVDPVVDLNLDSDLNTTEADMPVTLVRDTVYYWRVTSYEPNDVGTMVPIPYVGPTWTFETLPSVPVITEQPPVTLYVDAGDDIAISVAAYNPFEGYESEVSYQWYDVATDSPLVDAAGDYSGTATSTLTVLDTQIGDVDPNGLFCRVTNTAGNDASKDSDICVVQVKILLGHWPFDGNLNDVVGGNHGSATDPNYATGIVGGGQAAEFSGADDDVISMPTTSTTAWSLSWWENSTQGAGGSGQWETMVGNGVSSGFEIFEFGRLDATGYAFGLGDYRYLNDYPRGEWHFHVVAYDDLTQTGAWYLDGLKVPTSFSYGFTGFDTEFFVGNVRDLSQAFYGKIDDLKLYNYPMSLNDVGLAYSDVVGPYCPDEHKPAMDLDDDCDVDTADLAVFVSAWLDCGIYPATECP